MTIFEKYSNNYNYLTNHTAIFVDTPQTACQVKFCIFYIKVINVHTLKEFPENFS